MRFVKTVNINFADNLPTFPITKSSWSYLKLLLICLLELGFGFDQSLPRGKPVGKSPYYRSFDRSANWRVKDSMTSFIGNPSVYTIYGVYLSLGSLIFNNGVCRETSAVFVKARSITWYHTTNRIPAVGIWETSMSNPAGQTRVVNKHTNRHYQGASERHILFKIIMNICCFLTRIHSGWLERVSTWKVTVIHSLESVGCLVLFGSSQLSKSNCQRSTWLPCASHMGYSVHTPNFWTSGDLVGTSALHVQLVRRTSQHWIVIWTLVWH